MACDSYFVGLHASKRVARLKIYSVKSLASEKQRNKIKKAKKKHGFTKHNKKKMKDVKNIKHKTQSNRKYRFFLVIMLL